MWQRLVGRNVLRFVYRLVGTVTLQNRCPDGNRFIVEAKCTRLCTPLKFVLRICTRSVMSNRCQFGAGAKLRGGDDRREFCSPAITALSVHLADEGHLLDTPKALDSIA